MWALVRICLILGALVIGIWGFGMREPVDTEVRFDPSAIGDDLDAYLTGVEDTLGDVKDSARKRVLWYGAPGERTPSSVLYIHGFSATSQEMRPVPDQVAAALGANLVFTRLAGHGRPGDAMGEATVNDWVQDLAEGLEVARRAGDRVLVIAMSTGGTLSALIPIDPVLSRDVAGIVFVSPNFRVNDPLAFLLTWPFARTWVPLVVGVERAWEVRRPEQTDYWTTRYPTVSILPMAALVRYVDRLDIGTPDIPALFLFSDDDAVVDPQATRAFAARWGAGGQILSVDMMPGSDPESHVIAGDIMSPAMTDSVTADIVAWAIQQGMGRLE
ncbi:MAG: alpha/beta hydrolase [Pseudomonadota bacterium]